MKLLVVSHKEMWADPGSPSGYSTIGGFPFQMEALSTLFSSTTLMLPVHQDAPNGLRPLNGNNLNVIGLPQPAGQNLRRKAAMVAWLPQNLRKIRFHMRLADAVHAPVPGDIGFVGLLAALTLRKPLFVRHCGTWGEPVTLADRLLLMVLERVAGNDKVVVMATGGGTHLPSRKNPNITWIFSTTLTQQDWASLPARSPWGPGQTLRLATVCRLTPEKNVEAVIQAMPVLRDAGFHVSLDVVGDGPNRPTLETLVRDMSLGAQVCFHGNVNHASVLRVLSDAHLFIFPTRVKEGFPKAVLEAMAAGLPVIATGVSVIPHLVMGCGVILQETDHKAVGEAIKQVASKPDQFTMMGQQARLRAQQYTLEAWRDAIGEKLQAAWGPLNSGHATSSIPAAHIQ